MQAMLQPHLLERCRQLSQFLIKVSPHVRALLRTNVMEVQIKIVQDSKKALPTSFRPGFSKRLSPLEKIK